MQLMRRSVNKLGWHLSFFYLPGRWGVVRKGWGISGSRHLWSTGKAVPAAAPVPLPELAELDLGSDFVPIEIEELNVPQRRRRAPPRFVDIRSCMEYARSRRDLIQTKLSLKKGSIKIKSKYDRLRGAWNRVVGLFESTSCEKGFSLTRLA